MIDPDTIRAMAHGDVVRAADQAISGERAVALPTHFNLHDLEPFLENRRRARGTMTTASSADFATYAAEHKEDGASVFVDRATMRAVAVLNLGTPAAPGHADNLAVFAPVASAAYAALLKNTGPNTRLGRREAAEFVEDWLPHITCKRDGMDLDDGLAVAALRTLSIEAAKKTGGAEGNHSSERTAFESVRATATNPLPTTIEFVCEPYANFSLRTFVLRVSVLTDGPDPAFRLHIVKKEEHDEQMAAEMSEAVRAAMHQEVPVLLGTYAAKS